MTAPRRILVVGGGAVGSGIADHLAKAGWDTMLVERDLPMLPICHYVTVYMYDPARLQGISRHPRLEQYVGRLGLAPSAP